MQSVARKQLLKELYQRGVQALHEAADDIDASSSHQLLAVDVVAAHKVPDQGQKSGDEKTLVALRPAFQEWDESLNASDAVDHVFDVLE